MGTSTVNYLSASNHCYLGYDTSKDPYSPSVVLLLNMEGSVGSSTFLDDSYTPRSITNNGSVVYSAATKPFGSTSAAFGGSSNLSCVSTGFKEHVNSNWTMEVMANFTNLTSEPAICGQYNPGLLSWSFRVSSSGVKFYWSLNGTTETSVLFPTGISLGVWHSIALVKEGLSLRCYLNGAPIGTTQTVSNNIFASTSPVYIGTTNNGASNTLTGYLKCFRFTTAARYTNCAVVPTDTYSPNTTTNPYNFYTSTEGDSLWSDTLLQLHFSGLDGSKVLEDSSPYQQVHEVIESGAFISYNQAKFNESSLYLNAVDSGSFVEYPGPFLLSDKTFTLEFWIYPTTDGVPTGETLCYLGSSGSEIINGGIHITRGADRKIDFFVGPGTLNTDSWTASYTAHGVETPIYTWSHIALVTKVSAASTSYFLYVNGTWQNNGHSKISFPPCSLFIGRRNALNPPSGHVQFTGYMDEFVLTRGEGRYDGTFTPPTAQFKDKLVRDPFFRNVMLLVNGEGSDDIERVSDKSTAQREQLVALPLLAVNTTSPTFGSGALQSTGEVGGAYLAYTAGTDCDLSPSGVLANDKDFTVDCWVRHVGIVGAVGWISRQNATGTNGWYLATNSLGKPTFVANVGSGMQVLLTSATALSANLYYHLAVTRAGNILRLYVDGVAKASYTLTTPFVDAVGEPILVGANIESGGSVLDTPKIIEEARFTHGVARYKTGVTFAVVRAGFPTS